MWAKGAAMVEDDAGLWVANFNTGTDPWNNARVEHAMLLLARACGLATAKSRVINVAGRDVLLVKRFDRERTDAGPRNHALIAKERDWRLSPAYDLTPAVPISVEHRDLAMQCGDLGRFANADNLSSQSARFLLEKDQASWLIDDMESRIRSEWYATAREAGVCPADCERIAGAIAYEGFRQIAGGTRK